MSNPCALCGAADAAAFDVAPRHISVELCPTCTAGATGVAVALGVATWLAFTLYLHGLLIGVRPLG